MKKPEQLPKKEHIHYINDCAMVIWNKLKLEEGKWLSCLKEALRQHRLYLIQCIEERKRIESEINLSCEGCGIRLNDEDIFRYVSFCHKCFRIKYIDAVCVSTPMTSKHFIKPRITGGVCL